MSVEITPAESVAPVYLIEVDPEEGEPLNLAEVEQQRAEERESALAKLRLLGLTDEEIAAILPQ